MLPIVGVPKTIQRGLLPYRKLFGRAEGFEHIGRYITGLILSTNKTLQGIYDGQVWEGDKLSRRAMHEAVFEPGWDAEGLLPRHRAVIAPEHQGPGREVIRLDWTLLHREHGPEIYGVSRSYDYVAPRMGRFQTVVTAVVANRQVIDGIDLQVQEPSVREEEVIYLRATVQESYTQMEQARERLLELLHHLQHRLAYEKRTEIVVEIVTHLEEEGQFPQAHYAFDNGVLTLELTRLIESKEKHWVSELESSPHIQWTGQWRRIDEVATELRQAHPEAFRLVQVRCRNGERKSFWVFTKTIRLKRYGCKRIVLVHERADLTDTPRFLVSDALHWESGRIIETRSFRWAAKLFHEFSKQETGLEAAQVRTEEAVTRHLRLSCLAQSLLQRTPAVASTYEKVAFAEGQITCGQRCHAIGREVFHSLLSVAKRLFADGFSCDQVAQVLMPA